MLSALLNALFTPPASDFALANRPPASLSIPWIRPRTTSLPALTKRLLRSPSAALILPGSALKSATTLLTNDVTADDTALVIVFQMLTAADLMSFHTTDTADERRRSAATTTFRSVSRYARTSATMIVQMPSTTCLMPSQTCDQSPWISPVTMLMMPRMTSSAPWISDLIAFQ